MNDVILSLSVVTLNVSVLNSLIKRQSGRMDFKNYATNVIYEGLTIVSQTWIDWKWRDKKR